jgi:dihydrofolate synthase/folylpolyglutamate synthase
MMDKIRTYSQALQYIYNKLPMYQRVGPIAYKKDLTNTIRLCEASGNPQNSFRTIHIAGTNGKGTTTHIIAGGLQSQSLQVGVYTSPHYKDFRERIKINGVYITKKYIINFLNQYYSLIEEIQPSFFEVTVALAFSYFRDQKVDFAVIETGLGGRLDSTNIIQPVLSVITNISYDHQNLLGKTLAAIAGEKAGIIKKNTAVVIGETQPDISNVFIGKAKLENAEVTFADKHIRLLRKSNSGDNNFTYDVFVNGKIWIQDLHTDLSGPFQEKNLITGFGALEYLSHMFHIDKDSFKLFFGYLKKHTGYIGRWQILNQHPLTIADSAHNEAGLKIVVSELNNMKFNTLHIVLGFVNDKEIHEILELFPENAKYYFAKANIPRGLNAMELKNTAKGYHLSGKPYISVAKAYAAARRSAKKSDLIFIGGSIFVVAEVL